MKATRKKSGGRDISIQIRGKILDGKIDFDEKLPSERALAESYGVSRGTVRSALKNLEKQNYINVKRGSGAFVSFERAKAIVSPEREHQLRKLTEAWIHNIKCKKKCAIS